MDFWKAGKQRAIAGLLVGSAVVWWPVAAMATVVIDPVAMAIQPGLHIGIASFITAPATGSSGRLAALQGMRALNDGSGRLFVTDTRGLVSVTTTAGEIPRPWFDIRTQAVGFAEINSQAGLLSIAFHPNFNGDPTRPGYGIFYTVYTTATSAGTPDFVGNGGIAFDHHNVVREWHVADPAAPVAEIDASREVLRVAQPLGDHGPGTISFNTSVPPGTSDYGKLYIGFGDGGGVGDPFNNAQDLGSPFGKILRIDPVDPDGTGPLKFTVPADNPHVGETNAIGAIWASGLRNPQQFGWDDATGRMYIADIGQAQLEEVNLGERGANYGWPTREGTFGRSPDKGSLIVNNDLNPGFVDPIAQYDHDEGSAISGAILYRGGAIPDLFGQMVISELVNGRLFYYAPEDSTGQAGLPIMRELMLDFAGMPTSLLALEGPSRVDLRMGIDALGEIYLLTKRDGDIYRLIPSTAVPEPASWVMLILGAGATGAVLRRRRRRSGSALAPE